MGYGGKVGERPFSGSSSLCTLPELVLEPWPHCGGQVVWGTGHRGWTVLEMDSEKEIQDTLVK